MLSKESFDPIHKLFRTQAIPRKGRGLAQVNPVVRRATWSHGYLKLYFVGASV